jgi:hypothetical protein
VVPEDDPELEPLDEEEVPASGHTTPDDDPLPEELEEDEVIPELPDEVVPLDEAPEDEPVSIPASSQVPDEEPDEVVPLDEPELEAVPLDEPDELPEPLEEPLPEDDELVPPPSSPTTVSSAGGKIEDEALHPTISASEERIARLRLFILILSFV